MDPTNTLATSPFAFRKTKPFSRAELKFSTALADYAARELLSKLQARTLDNPDANHYTGINTRLTGDAVFLQAIMTNAVEWGGFFFEFARLQRANGDVYNLYLRSQIDWDRAERGTIASASTHFIAATLSPRASDWVPMARRRTFEECIELLRRDLPF